MTTNIRFLRHDRHAEPNPTVRHVTADTVRENLGDELLARLTQNARPAGKFTTGSYAIEARGFVWEAIRIA